METKKVTNAFIALMLVACSAAWADCDEDCQKQKAEEKHAIKFASYLTWDFCEDTRDEFITSSISSLEKYSTENFDARYKGGMKNIKKYIENRVDWLKECNQYLSFTGKGHIFDDKKTTDAIFDSLVSVTKELDGLIKGATYSSDSGSDTQTVIQERFEELFGKVDQHKTLMHLKGRYVNR